MPKEPTSVIGAGSASDGFEGDEEERGHQLESDALRGVAGLLKAGGLERLASRGKALAIDESRLKAKRPLKELTYFLRISRSSCEHRRDGRTLPDEIDSKTIRERMRW